MNSNTRDIIDSQVLIETSWNVKSGRKDTIETAVAVLIETSWNVKDYRRNKTYAGTVVLIETSWNVKNCADSLCTHLVLY